LTVIKFSNISPSNASRVVLNPRTKHIPECNLKKLGNLANNKEIRGLGARPYKGKKITMGQLNDIHNGMEVTGLYVVFCDPASQGNMTILLATV